MRFAKLELVHRVAKFHVRTRGRGIPFVYANGKHQAAIYIVFEAYDAENRYLNVSPEELLRRIELIDVETGEQLGKDSSGGWRFSSSFNGYPMLQHSDDEISNGHLHTSKINENVKLYVSTLFDKCIKIAAQVRLADGRCLSTCNDSPAGEFKYVSVIARAVDYSDPRIWRVYSYTNFRPMANDIPCHEMLTPHSWSKTIKCETSFNRIRIELLIRPGIKIYVTEVSDSKQVMASTDISTGMSTGASVNAYAAHNWGDRLDVVSWFVNPWPLFGFRSGEIMLADTTFLIGSFNKVEIDQDDVRSVAEPYPPENDGFDVYVCRLTVPLPRLKQAGWENFTGIRKVHLSDRYGNEGTLKLDFSYDQYIPFLR